MHNKSDRFLSLKTDLLERIVYNHCCIVPGLIGAAGF
jgi:hypothetical protein